MEDKKMLNDEELENVNGGVHEQMTIEVHLIKDEEEPKEEDVYKKY